MLFITRFLACTVLKTILMHQIRIFFDTGLSTKKKMKTDIACDTENDDVL